MWAIQWGQEQTELSSYGIENCYFIHHTKFRQKTVPKSPSVALLLSWNFVLAFGPWISSVLAAFVWKLLMSISNSWNFTKKWIFFQPLKSGQNKVALVPSRPMSAWGRLGTRATEAEEPVSRVAPRLIWLGCILECIKTYLTGICF